MNDDVPEKIEVAIECRNKHYEVYRDNKTYCSEIDRDCLYKEECQDGHRCWMLEKQI